MDLALSIDGPRPEGLPAPQVQVVAHERQLASFTAEEEQTTYEVQYTPWIPSLDGDLVVEIFADTFVPSTGDRRTLGVLVDSVVATPVGTLYRAPWISILALSAAIAVSYPVLKSFGGTPAKGLIGALILLALIGCLMVLRVQGMLAFSLLLPGACGLCYLVVLITIAPLGPTEEPPVICGLCGTPYDGNECPICKTEREQAKRVIRERLRKDREEKDSLIHYSSTPRLRPAIANSTCELLLVVVQSTGIDSPTSSTC